MTTPSIGFIEQGLLCYRDLEDPTRFNVVPGGPRPNPSTPPSVVEWGKTSTVGLVGEWMLTDDQLRAMREAVVLRHPELDPRLLKVVQAPASHVKVHEMTLEWVDPSGQRQALGSSSTSQTPPFSAVFQISLDQAQRDPVRQALKEGKPGLLFLTLSYALLVPVKAKARLTGRVPAPTQEQLLALPQPVDEATARTLLRQSIDRGAVSEEVNLLPEGTPAQAISVSAREQAWALAASQMVSELTTRVAQQRQQEEQAREAAKKKPGPSIFEKLWGGKKNGPKTPTQPPPPSPPIPLDTNIEFSDRVRIPARPSPSAPEQWLTASTDLGIWSAK